MLTVAFNTNEALI